MIEADNLDAVESWLGDLVTNLSPRERKRFALKVGQVVRRANAARIAANQEPGGGKMAPRKSRLDRSGKVKSKGKMFRKLRLAKNLKIRADPDGVELHFASASVGRTAAVHHFGMEDRVGKTRKGRTIRIRYEARRLLGFGEGERDAIMDMALTHLQS